MEGTSRIMALFSADGPGQVDSDSTLSATPRVREGDGDEVILSSSGCGVNTARADAPELSSDSTGQREGRGGSVQPIRR